MPINGLGHSAPIGMTLPQGKPQGPSFLGQVKAALDFVGRKLGLIKAPAESVDRSQTPGVMPGATVELAHMPQSCSGPRVRNKKLRVSPTSCNVKPNRAFGEITLLTRAVRICG